ncbi:outer membrane beta-barrel protein [Pyxidicoccus parkwayensis]|uniref:Outer membrane beta-barrel protein n=1 Tax=Pyxidicoccus parkwayensis TaxID=2813578 RepID=A0ABX7NSU6_9BACT|nr:OmpW family outer membrane protein [Pyxidicoccus parkwaysis]QSQ21471.1 outer membrane beta-barrel protein [Pyxidicoccus parkwaysis]
MNTRMLCKLASLSLLFSSSAALADDDLGREKDSGYEDADLDAKSSDGAGFALGLRAGYGLPFGKAAGGGDSDSGKLSDFVSGVVPLQLDAGYFINSNVYVGANFQYGLGFLKEDCPEGASCSLSQMRLGLNVAYHFMPGQKLRPWLGLGVGYEMLDTSISATQLGISAKVKQSVRGLEFAAFQGGFDYKLNDSFSVGPFLTATVGQYSTVSSKIEVDGVDGVDPVDDSQDIEEKAIHTWLQGGVRMQVHF